MSGSKERNVSSASKIMTGKDSKGIDLILQRFFFGFNVKTSDI